MNDSGRMGRVQCVANFNRTFQDFFGRQWATRDAFFQRLTLQKFNRDGNVGRQLTSRSADSGAVSTIGIYQQPTA